MDAGRTTLARQCGQRRRLRVLGEQQVPWARAAATGARPGSYAQGSQVQPPRALASGGAGVSPWPRQRHTRPCWPHSEPRTCPEAAGCPRFTPASMCVPCAALRIRSGVGLSREVLESRDGHRDTECRQMFTLRSKRCHCLETPTNRSNTLPLLTATREGPGVAVKTPHNTKTSSLTGSP